MSDFKLIIILGAVIILAGCGSSRKTSSSNGKIIVVDDGTTTTVSTSPESLSVTSIDKSKVYTHLQKKYAGFLNISPAQITNTKLYGFIDKWLATPYLWGGTDKNGIDCSAFVQKLIDEVYDVNIPRTSIEQFYADWIELFGSKEYLSEGDMVFFRTLPGTLVSHIGFYLKNRMFVNSSSSKGVSVASLDDPYWKKKYVAAGRIKSSMLANFKKKN